MWTREIFDTDVYHLIAAFIIYSMIGWLVESIYMSFCNKKLTNRGFGRGPFCPIYGFGGVIGYLVLRPLSENLVQLYLAGAVLATLFEFLVGKLMLRLFGEVWWDYNEKPCNYKGIICLESSIAWGFLGIFFFRFLNGFVNRMVGYIPETYEKVTALALVSFYVCDFTYTQNVQRHRQPDEGEEKEQVIGRLKVY